MHRYSLPSVLGFCLGVNAFGATAGDGDHDRARAAVEAGRTRPLAEILETVHRDYPGEVIDVELEDDYHSGRVSNNVIVIYEIKVRTPDGRILKLCYDAQTGILHSVRKR